jgi:hypothetical protein
LLATVPLSAAAGISATLSGTRGLHGVVTLIFVSAAIRRN